MVTASDTMTEENSINLDELQEEAEKLLALLKNRQLGLLTWNLFLCERLENLHTLSSKALQK
ncbi:MAG: hypothetical protein AAB482_01160 [Patescibacteria group bacterium]